MSAPTTPTTRPGADAALIQDCARFLELEKAFADPAHPDAARELEQMPEHPEYLALEAVIAAASPATPEGWAALSRVALLCDTAVQEKLWEEWDATRIARKVLEHVAADRRAPSSDVPLIALLDEAKRQMREACPMSSPGAPDAPGPWASLMRQAAAIPARTSEGLRAKAEIAAGWMTLGCPADGIPNPAQAEQHVAWSLLQDLLGSTPALPTTEPAPSPDAELLAACEAYHAEERAWCAAFFREQEAMDTGDEEARRRATEEQVKSTARQKPHRETVIYTPARTIEGREAKAMVAMMHVETDSEGGPVDHRDGLLWSLAEDLVGRKVEVPL